MKVVTTVEYTQEDKVMLKKPLPANPCDKCTAGTACCGCPDVLKYAEQVQPYRDAGIYDIARKMEKMREMEQQAKAIIAEYSKMNAELPHFAKLEDVVLMRVM